VLAPQQGQRDLHQQLLALEERGAQLLEEDAKPSQCGFEMIGVVGGGHVPASCDPQYAIAASRSAHRGHATKIVSR
jgi:hypothetical protein